FSFIFRKFAPETDDRILVTGAGDCKVRVHDVECTRRGNASGDSAIQVYGCHFARVKRVAAHRQEPHVILSAGEDGLVMQYDLREPADCRSFCNHALINLNAHLGPDCEIKCLALNPLRPEMMAIGANDHFVRVYDRRMIAPKPVKLSYDGSRRVLWDRSAILSLNIENIDYNFPPNSVQYFIAGHLPVKCADRRNRFRRLTTTYLTFDPSGKSLLVNLGGEQIYLFDLYDEKKTSLLEDFRRFFVDEKSPEILKGIKFAPADHSRNIFLINRSPNNTPNLPFRVQLLKQKANSEFDRENFDSALALYSRALEQSPKTAILYSNRAAAYMRRDWDGDTYAALRDCYTTLHLEPENLKALFRLCKCLYELNQYHSAQCCLEIFMQKYPEQAQSHSCIKLWNEVSSSIKNDKNSDSPTNKRQRTFENNSGATSHQQQNQDLSTDSANGERDELYSNLTPTSNNFLSDQEKSLQSRAYDYCKRYCGHCNTTTDIKEANFFGCNGEYVMGGSDDGKFFIWDSRTCEIVKAMVGDDKIVNCLQPHPTQCLLATSGIEHTVKNQLYPFTPSIP
uniref:WD and tetratricopeptide repeats protein 1 n=1 Tax=Romanomermis culicivorax TaxID=13658 RepID=A0A915IQG4_ROMCU